ncbi:hypothetical protein [Mucilaginibacter endophyticus]|uniref:hypothetical protein n=1 Tax=Mucilaginibacter endophyticus TaxID=2675003 RepID=UPI000E0DD69F|nr:hypothetical protein [Mucilaginibacter endophyticus]
MDLNQVEISSFWDWFKTISADLLINPTDTYFINLLDTQVSKLGNVDWEIGPWEENVTFLAISPNLNFEQLDFTRKVIDAAPYCSGWKFLPSKPPKDWCGIWEMENEIGKTILVDTSNWTYILHRFDDEGFGIDFQIPDFAGDQTTQYVAIDIALTGYLGEEPFMNLIQDINIVDDFGEEMSGKATSLKYIKKHIEQII